MTGHVICCWLLLVQSMDMEQEIGLKNPGLSGQLNWTQKRESVVLNQSLYFIGGLTGTRAIT